MEESCYRKLSKDMHEKNLHVSTKCNDILVFIGEDWSLSRLEYQVNLRQPNLSSYIRESPFQLVPTKCTHSERISLGRNIILYQQESSSSQAKRKQ